MKASTFTPTVAMAAVLALVLAACQHEGKKGGETAQSKAAQATQSNGHPAQPEPGAQQGPGAQLMQQDQQGGPATALGLPGASAAQASGEANLQAGERLSIQGGANNVMACGGCHGAQGEGNAAGGLPRIAGQSQAYLGRQLGAYANDARVNPIMQPIAKAMSAQQIRDVSAYYASLGSTPGATSTAPAAAKPSDAGWTRGRLLSEVGDESRGVQACANCHGPGGVGKQPDYPYLAGQHANYLTAAMGAWKSGARKTDGSGQMPHIARALADADVAALSSYFAAQPAPPPAASSTVRGPGTQGKQQQTPAPVRR
ncbi:c-type cytochrome [Massilia sp. LXY-6]|uniref:c-type cytochrome n=1 Tax=Massilia sp. LXY-6 TaxID=3379823 RepID=UPI003EE25BF3